MFHVAQVVHLSKCSNTNNRICCFGARSYFDGEAGTTTGDFLSLPLKIFMIMFQITASIGTTALLPLVFIRLGILPSPTNDELDLSVLKATKGINFLAVSATCCIALMHCSQNMILILCA